jgi:hypothetical protein
VRKLIVKGDERIGTALPSTIFHQSHVRSVSRGHRLGQVRRRARTPSRLRACEPSGS